MITGRARPGTQPTDRGGGTILIMAVVIFLLMITSALSVVGQYLVAEQRARAAADLAALAGAQAYGSGQDGCATAARYARANGHRLDGCSVIGDPIDFLLTARVTAPAPARIPGLPAEITADANAGPVR